MALGTLLTGLSLWAVGVTFLVLLIGFKVGKDLVLWYKLRHIPGPVFNSVSIIPILLAAASGRLPDYLTRLNEKYGPIVRIAPGEVMFVDADVSKHLSSLKSGYDRGGWYSGIKVTPERDNVLSLVNEEEHQKRKAQLSPGYTQQDYATHEPCIDRQIRSFLHLLERKYVSTADAPRFCNLADKANFLTLDIIGDMALSSPFGFLENDRDMYDFLEVFGSQLPVMTVINSMPHITKWLWRWPFRMLLPSAGDQVGFGRLVGWSKAVVDSRTAPEAKPKKDMLQAFIDHGIDRNDLLDEIIIQVLAGSDTIASAIRLTILELIHHPPAYRKLQDEIDAAILSGVIPPCDIIPDSAARTLPYLQAVIREALRMWPPANGLAGKKVPAGGDVLLGHFVPAGTQVCQNMFGMMRMKSFWGEDADVFRPERWLECSEERGRDMKAFADLVFGSGRFACLGKQIAVKELNKVFVELFRRYDIGVINALNPLMMRSAVTWIAEDFWVRITRREEKA